MSYIDATLQLSQYGSFVSGATPLRPTVGTGHVPIGFQAEIIDGQYYPDRPLPASYRPLENPFASSLPIINAMQDNYGAGASPFGVVAQLYANQNKFTAALLAGRDAENGLNLRA
ncbi:hypothetical protein GCM10011332_28450 [Terasakiella brassicae]|uniref:Uncharacterized protein n=1 Tax=Terasakiella brassicae TaxID=1634917 RepID=A0A917C6S0_9PROT|nr:hypothetical protein [Terasakiella brassicae]GGF72794.1 hypothetical protein GCM10011332_28450 [Terasakiella brassicae]